jgi:hypothetical protein
MGKLLKQMPSRKVALRTPGQFEFTPANSKLVTYIITTRAFYKKM